MARNRVIIETITCDLCGRELESAITKRIAADRGAWVLDLCEDDARKVDDQIALWTVNARKADAASPRASAKQNSDDWAYLESLGFKRHRGRKTPAENAALANR